jgi:methylglutaconyl-CoA hydratase
MTAPAFLDIRRDGAVVHVTLNRPDVRNAFNEQLIAEITAWAADAARDDTVRAVVLAGAGKVFCAGADLEWMSRMVAAGHDENIADARALGAMFEALDTIPIPIVGRLHGAALGGGAGLAAVCDVAIASEDCVFGFTEVKLGILPAVISPYVVAKVGQSAARQLCLTGKRFSAARAREIGLVHEVAPAANLDTLVSQYVDEIMSGGRAAIAATKTLLAAVAGHPPAQVAGLTAEAIAEQRVSPEGQEGMRAFLDRRPPAWAAPKRSA